MRPVPRRPLRLNPAQPRKRAGLVAMALALVLPAVAGWSPSGLAQSQTQTPAQAQAAASDYPSRTIRFVVPFGPGSGTDTSARY